MQYVWTKNGQRTRGVGIHFQLRGQALVRQGAGSGRGAETGKRARLIFLKQGFEVGVGVAQCRDK